jgi:hypothetical protein
MKKNKARPQAKDARSGKRLSSNPAHQAPAQEQTKEPATAAKSIFDSISLPVVIVLVILLSVLAFKNISYPLLWNDESDTIITGQQVLKYGYPKVHDGKNTIFLTDNPLWLGYDSIRDMNTQIPWGSYYFSAIGVWIAQHTGDIYQKTAIVRIPFVAAGLLGILIFGFAMRGLFSSRFSFRVYFAAFLILEMLSVNMLLNIREARYYSMVILVCGCYFYVFAAYHFYRKYSRNTYFMLLTIILLVAYNINFITHFAIFATTCLYHCYAFFTHRKGKLYTYDLRDSFILLIPLIISSIIIVPEFAFFGTLKMASLANLYYQNSFEKTITHLGDMFFCMHRFDLLYSMLIIKVLRAGYGFMVYTRKVTVSGKTNKIKAMALFMLIFLLCYIFFAARLPNVFMRYYCVVQPVSILILLTDVLIILDYAALLYPRGADAMARVAIVPVTGLVCLINLAAIDNHISDYLYQCTHPYYGPLDYYIPALKERYKHPENLVIATNYEELCYEYYLGSKVIWGYQNQFIPAEDSTIRRYSPDVLIIRPAYVQDNKPYNYYLQHVQYQKITFPVLDCPVNNMADLHIFVTHQFRTNYALSEEQKAYMFVKAK